MFGTRSLLYKMPLVHRRAHVETWEAKVTCVRLSPKTQRAQFVCSAITVIAEVGYRAATFERIAKHASPSNAGLISYHFDRREELMREVVEAVRQQAAHYVRSRMDTQLTPSAVLHAYIEATIEFHAKFPLQIAALNAVLSNMRLPDGRLEFGPETIEPELDQLQHLMRRAQVLGEMTYFDTRVAAISLHCMLDGISREMRTRRVDPTHYAAEAIRLFTAGTGQVLIES